MKQIIFFLLVIVYLTACENNSKSRPIDTFYSDKGGFDFGRIPLIKPYEIINSSRGDNWVISAADTSSAALNIPGIRSLNILDSAVFIYGQETTVEGQPVKAAWFVVNPKKQISHGFVDHKLYLNYIHSMGLTEEPKLYNATDVYQYFDKNDTINWQDISKTLKPVN